MIVLVSAALLAATQSAPLPAPAPTPPERLNLWLGTDAAGRCRIEWFGLEVPLETVATRAAALPKATEVQIDTYVGGPPRQCLGPLLDTLKRAGLNDVAFAIPSR